MRWLIQSIFINGLKPYSIMSGYNNPGIVAAVFILFIALGSFTAGADLETGDPVSDHRITGIGCDLDIKDACYFDDELGLPEDSACITNDNTKLVLGVNMPNDLSCEITLNASFNGTSEPSEDIMVSVNGYARVWEDDGREEGISVIDMPGRFPFIEGNNEIILTHPNFDDECRNDPDMQDGDIVSGDLIFGTIAVHDCTERTSPDIEDIGISPDPPNYTDNIVCSGFYSGDDINQEKIEWYQIDGNNRELVRPPEQQCVPGPGTYSSTLSASYTETDDIFACVVTVLDSNGMKDTREITFRIGEGILNQPPQARILFPTQGAYFFLGRQITCEGIATDEEDGGMIDENGISWSYVYRARERPLSHERTLAFGEVTSAPIEFNGTGIYRIRMTAMDSQGLTSSDSVTIHVYNPFSFVYIPVDRMKMMLASSDFIKETLVNDMAAENVYTLSLWGYERAQFLTNGLDNIIYESPDKREVRVRLEPFSSMNIFIKVFADNPGVYTLRQNSTSENTGETKVHDPITLEIGYSPDFPESDSTIIFIIILITSGIYMLFIRK